MTTDTRELMADLPQTARLDERKDNARAHAARLAGLIDAPVLKEVPARHWRAEYWVAGEMQTVLLSQAINAQPDMQGRILKAQVQLTCHHRFYPHNVKILALYGDIDLIEIVAFLGLDALSPDMVSWRDVTRYRTLLTVEAVVARSTTRVHD